MGRCGRKCFEDAAEVKRAYVTIVRKLGQRNIVGKAKGQVFFRPLDGNEVVLFEPFMDGNVWVVVGIARQYALDDLHHGLVDLQFASRFGQYQLQDMKMEEFCFRRSLD